MPWDRWQETTLKHGAYLCPRVKQQKLQGSHSGLNVLQSRLQGPSAGMGWKNWED